MNKTTTLFRVSLCAIILLISFNAQAQNPGNIGDTNLQLWLKANKGVITSGSQVTQWDDNSPNGFSATKEGSNQGPRLLEDGLNFNPTLAFDNGITQYLRMANTDTPELNLNPRTDKLTFFTVFVADDADSEGVIFSKANGSTRNYVVWLGEINRTVHYTGGMGSGSGNIGHHWGDETLDARYEPKISTGYVTDGTYGGSPRHVYKSFVNGVFDDFPAENPNSNTGNAGIGSGSHDTDILIGARRSGTNSGAGFLLHDAEIAEIIIYDKQLSATDIAKVESYLAIKYGVTLGYNDSEAADYFGVSNDYILSDGTTKAWEGTANKDYGYAVFGLARDDQSDLEQLKSTSTNVQRIISGSNTTILNSILVIESESSSIADNKSYLMVGHNGYDVQVETSSMPERVNSTINRKWKARESANDIGTVKLYFDLSQYSLSSPADYDLIVSKNENLTNYKNYRGTYNSSTKVLIYEGVNIDDAEYFTLAKVQEMDDSYEFSFDGTSKYIDLGDDLDLNPSGFTFSTWVKLDNSATYRIILAKRDNAYTQGYDFRIDNVDKFVALWKSSGGTAVSLKSSKPLSTGKWHHVAIVYNGTDATMYIDGLEDVKVNGAAAPGITSQSCLIGALGESPTAYFSGELDELRVWNTALTVDQLHYTMNQEVENTSGSTIVGSYFNNRGITPTKNETSSLSWANLKGYFTFSRVRGNCLFDASSSSVNGRLYNTPNSSIEAQTAPLPYKTVASGGNWKDASTWLNGNVQNTPGSQSVLGTSKYITGNIVELDHNVTIDNTTNIRDVNLLALFVDNNKLTLDGDNSSGTGFGLTVTHYLNLDGDIDLNGESQLIQTLNSDLEVASSGKIERDQQGTKDLYTYNYWSSPVGVSSTSNNNTSYKLPNILRNGTNAASPSTITFLTSGYDGNVSGSNISIADYWIWKFNNLPDDDYASWQHVRSTGDLSAGEGYTMKGVANTNGDVAQEQNYVFTGKPNNGVIELDLDDNSDYLVGNPYASAIDAEQFILDNGPDIDQIDGVTTGSLYFWEHWGGGSHILAEYQGGYGTYNLSGSTPAAYKADVDPDVNQDGVVVGTKTPGRYIPVGQGFFVVGSKPNGKVQFNNGQRVFIKESVGTSVFMEANNNSNPDNPSFNNNSNTDESIDERMKIRLGFNSINTIHRQLLVTVDERASIDYDWGFDAIINEDQIDDMYWMMNDEKYVIQGIDEIDESNTVLPIGMHTNVDGINTITIDALENISEDVQIFLHDKELELYHDLRASNYEIFLNAGEYLDRFEITFSNQDALSLAENTIENVQVNYTNSIESIVIMNPKLIDIKTVELYSLLGQSIYNNTDIKIDSNIVLEVKGLSSGTYIIKLNTEDNRTITQKVLIN